MTQSPSQVAAEIEALVERLENRAEAIAIVRDRRERDAPPTAVLDDELLSEAGCDLLDASDKLSAILTAWREAEREPADEDQQALARFDGIADSYVASARAAVASPLPAPPVPEAVAWANSNTIAAVRKHNVQGSAFLTPKQEPGQDMPLYATPPPPDGWRDMLAGTLTAAKMLYANAVGCAINHYAGDFERQGLPGWLADCERDILAFEAALSRSESPLAEDGWRADMENAPKDGTRIWALDDATGYLGKVAFDGFEWECISYNDMPMGIGFYPTHWMPLPASPLPHGGDSQ